MITEHTLFFSALRKALLLIASIPLFVLIAIIALLYAPMHLLTKDTRPSPKCVEYRGADRAANNPVSLSEVN